MSILFVDLDHPYQVGSEPEGPVFDNSILGDILGADVGYPLAADGTQLGQYYGMKLARLFVQTVEDVHVQTSTAYNERFSVTSEDLLTDDVELRSGEVVSLGEYDTIIVTHLWLYNYYIAHVARTHPDTTLIGVQDESVQDVLTFSSGLQRQHRDVLAAVDGYVATNAQYERYVSPFVDHVLHQPLPVPEGQFDGCPVADAGGPVCIGVGTWNADLEAYYSNYLVLDALRDRGYDRRGEIVGVQDFQEPLVAGFGEAFEDVDVVGFIEDGFYEYLARFSLVVMLPVRTTAGRVPAELAGLGVPCVGNERNDHQQRCWPELSTDVYDLPTAIDLAERVLDDADFRRRVVERARSTVRDLQDHGPVERRLRNFLARVRDGGGSGADVT